MKVANLCALALLAFPVAAGAQTAGGQTGGGQTGGGQMGGVAASTADARPPLAARSPESASTAPVLLDDLERDGETGRSVTTETGAPDDAPAPRVPRERVPSTNEAYNRAREAEGRVGVRLGDEMGTRVSGQ